MSAERILRQSGAGQNLTIGASAVQSTAAPTGVYAVRLTATGNCHVSINSAAAASVAATDALLKSTDIPQLFAISPTEKVSVIQDAASTGTLNVVWLTQ